MSLNTNCNRFSFPSLARKNIFYAINKEQNEFRHRRGTDSVCRHAVEYDTLGDGRTQHTPDQPIARGDARDFLDSLAAHLAYTSEDERDLLASAMNYSMHVPSKDEIEFAASIKYDEAKDLKKTRYYSRKDRKISSSENKRHDKRFEKIESWHDGGFKSMLGILLDGTYVADYLELLLIADAAASHGGNRHELEQYLDDTASHYETRKARNTCDAAERISRFADAWRTIRRIEDSGRICRDNVTCRLAQEQPAYS